MNLFTAAFRRKTTTLLLLFCLLSFALPALAGEGDGSGGGKGEPLALLRSEPADGAVGVTLPVTIRLYFNKNVINLAVRDNNQKCFALYAADGTKIPITVGMADDQIEPEKKREVALYPLVDLKPGTQYIAVVGSGLTAKSGVVLGKDVSIRFTTAGRAVQYPTEEKHSGVTAKPAVSSAVPTAVESSNSRTTSTPGDKDLPVNLEPDLPQATGSGETAATVADEISQNNPAGEESASAPAAVAGSTANDRAARTPMNLEIQGIIAGILVLCGLAYVVARRRTGQKP